jgi:histidinol-phosphate/aromatic aminotransferase/cobyric acid decarboxylase-like protein
MRRSFALCVNYYRSRWQETAVLRDELQAGLEAQGWDVVPGCANFLLCHLPESAPDAARFVAELRRRGLFIRDVTTMGTALGWRAVRIAVKDRATNHRMLGMLAAALSEVGVPSQSARRNATRSAFSFAVRPMLNRVS